MGEYSRAFGTFVNWEIDIIYIGGRVGHLHNSQFLNEVEAGGGLRALKTLAIDYEVWLESRMFHGRFPSFKRCSPSAVVQQLKGLETLIVVGRAGRWRDGHELQWHESLEERKSRFWRHDDSESSSSSDSDEVREAEGSTESDDSDVSTTSENASDRDADTTISTASAESSSEDDSDEGDSEDSQGDTSSTAPEFSTDKWYCYFPHMAADGVPPLAYSLPPSDENERRVGPTGHCGLALVDYSKIPVLENAWEAEDDENYISAEEVHCRFRAEFHWMREPQIQMNDVPHQPVIDWTAWVPPKINLALCRRTARSCYVEDWDGLENEWMSPNEVNYAIENPKDYAFDVALGGRFSGHYPPGFLLLSGPDGEVRVPKIDGPDSDEDFEDK